MTLAKILNDISNQEQPMNYKDLASISGLSTDDVDQLEIVWNSLYDRRKQEIISMLVRLGDENAELEFYDVFKLGLIDSDEYVREQSIRGLWESEDRRLINSLIEILMNDRSFKVKCVAAEHLGKFITISLTGKLLNRDLLRVKQALLKCIKGNDGNFEVRRRSIEAISALNDPEIHEVILAAYENGDPELKESAIYAMGHSSDMKWLPKILAEIRHGSSAHKYEAATACGKLGDESNIQELVTLLEYDDLQVQLASINAIGLIGGTYAKQVLNELLDAEDEELSYSIASALQEIEFNEDPLRLTLDQQI